MLYERPYGIPCVTNDPGSKPDQIFSTERLAKLHSEELSINLGLRAERIASCVQYICTLGG